MFHLIKLHFVIVLQPLRKRFDTVYLIQSFVVSISKKARNKLLKQIIFSCGKNTCHMLNWFICSNMLYCITWDFAAICNIVFTWIGNLIKQSDHEIRWCSKSYLRKYCWNLHIEETHQTTQERSVDFLCTK